MELFYQEYGTEGPPLLILHGLFGSSGNWHTLSRSVFAEHFHVYSLDLRNHGRSPHSEVFDYPGMAADVLEFVDAHRLEYVYLLGHSMGGKVAMQAALDHPNRVRRLVVADIAPRAYPPNHLVILNALRALDLEAYASRAEIDEALSGKIADVGIRQFLLKNLSSDGAGSFSWKINLPAIYASYDRINEGLSHSSVYPNPALFIRGGRSNYVTDDDIARIQQLFPQARIADIPDAGHWVHAEAPKPFADLVVKFLT